MPSCRVATAWRDRGHGAGAPAARPLVGPPRRGSTVDGQPRLRGRNRCHEGRAMARRRCVVGGPGAGRQSVSLRPSGACRDRSTAGPCPWPQFWGGVCPATRRLAAGCDRRLQRSGRGGTTSSCFWLRSAFRVSGPVQDRGVRVAWQFGTSGRSLLRHRSVAAIGVRRRRCLHGPVGRDSLTGNGAGVCRLRRR